MDAALAHEFAAAWYAAWNAHDLDAVLEHYADDVEMSSPLVGARAGREGGKIVGKQALRASFEAALARCPDLHFEPLGLFVGVDSLVLNDVSVNGLPSAEVVFGGDDGKVLRYAAHDG